MRVEPVEVGDQRRVEERTRRAGARRDRQGQGHACGFSADGFRLVAEGRAELKKSARLRRQISPCRAHASVGRDIPALRPAQTEQPCLRDAHPSPCSRVIAAAHGPPGRSARAAFARPGAPKDRAGLCSSNRCRRRQADMLAAEADGLAALRATRTIDVPSVAGWWIDDAQDLSVLALQWLDFGPAQADFGERFGRALAALHASTRSGGDGRFGWGRDVYGEGAEPVFVDHVRHEACKPGERMLFIHTGGAPAPVSGATLRSPLSRPPRRSSRLAPRRRSG